MLARDSTNGRLRNRLLGFFLLYQILSEAGSDVVDGSRDQERGMKSMPSNGIPIIPVLGASRGLRIVGHLPPDGTIESAYPIY